MNTLETICATIVALAAMGELAVAKKWLVFSVSVRVPPPVRAKQPKPDTAAEQRTGSEQLRSAA